MKKRWPIMSMDDLMSKFPKDRVPVIARPIRSEGTDAGVFLGSAKKQDVHCPVCELDESKP